MKKNLIAFLLLICLITKTHSVLDFPTYFNHTTIYADQNPLDEVLLSDVNGTYFFNQTSFHENIHKKVRTNPLIDEELYEVSSTFRLLVLLPTKTTKLGEEIWVPYLIDTGSPKTWLTKYTMDALGLGDYSIYNEIYVANTLIQFAQSDLHFKDINLLGTDFMNKGSLIVNYLNHEFGVRIKNFTINIPPKGFQIFDDISLTKLKKEISDDITLQKDQELQRMMDQRDQELKRMKDQMEQMKELMEFQTNKMFQLIYFILFLCFIGSIVIYILMQMFFIKKNL